MSKINNKQETAPKVKKSKAPVLAAVAWAIIAVAIVFAAGMYTGNKLAHKNTEAVNAKVTAAVALSK